MSEDIKKEIEAQVTGTRLSIMKEFKIHMRNFYISVIGMLFCLVLGFYIGTSQTDSTAKMIFHTQKKIDLIMGNLGIKYNG